MMHGFALAARRACAWLALAAGLGMATAAHSQAKPPAVLVVGGASHTQAGFPDPRVQRFYVATAANAAEQVADALSKAGVRNAKFIVWSRYPEYSNELGMNIAACECNYVMQVSFGKNVSADPQTLFLQYELMFLARSATAPQRPGFDAVTTQSKFKRRFDIPITNEILQEAKFPGFAGEIVDDILKSGVFATN